MSAMQVVGVLDARARSGRIRRRPGRPSGPAGRPRCGCRRNWWRPPAASLRCDEGVNGRGVGQLDGHQPAEPLHLTRGHLMGRIVGQTRDTAPVRTAGWVRSIMASAMRVVALPLEAQPGAAQAAQQPATPRTAPSTAPASSRSRSDRRHQVGLAACDVSGEQITVPGQAPWWRWRPPGRRPARAAAGRAVSAVVLSTTRVAPRPRQVSASRCRSTTSSVGVGRGLGEHHVGAPQRPSHICGAASPR